MIVTLTAHPSLDKTIELPASLAPGHVHVAASSREDAGGKGINVARAVAAAGSATLAVLPLDEDDPYAAVLHATGISTERVGIAGKARSNITIVDPQGVTTKVNLPGARLTDSEARSLTEAVVRSAADAAWLVLAGSLPPGADEDFYVDVITAVRSRYGDHAPLIAVDTAGAALRAVVADGMPDLIKPNDDELAELTGVSLDTPDAAWPESVLSAARQIVPNRARAALVTLGARGALLITADGAWAGTPPPTAVASTVGAGDSALAGYLLADTEGRPEDDCLRHAIRYGAAAAALSGTQPPRPDNLPTTDIIITRVS